MNKTDEKLIEVEVTAGDIEIMRAQGVEESDLPALGIKRYRPARHIIRDKVAILLDADIVEHFKTNSDSDEFYQAQINKALRQVIESRRA
ncbi:MAG: hypothetical protein HOP17_13245 [Acidobacteria bacterium]|nr:hypothetical protein [Acidobacteriota bacterium]